MRLIGTTTKGHETIFDTVEAVGGENTASTPMEVMMQSVAACSSMDVLSILRKKRKTIEEFHVELDGERTETHPKIFKTLHLKYHLKSPDATEEDLKRCIELSQDKYCGASSIFKLSGCEVTYSMELTK